MAPKRAAPKDPPICRKNATELVATPMSERSTAFCTTTTTTCRDRPSPAPKTYIDSAANQ